METTLQAPPAVDIDALRATTLATLLRLACEHGLRLPRMVESTLHATAGPCLELDFEQYEQVDAWAGLLGLTYAPGYPKQHLIRMRHGDPAWLGWEQISLRCYDFHRVDLAVSA